MNPSPRAAGVLRHLRAARGDVDRDTALGDVVDRGTLGLVVLTLEVDPVTEHSSRISRTDSRSRAYRSLNSGHSPSKRWRSR